MTSLTTPDSHLTLPTLSRLSLPIVYPPPDPRPDLPAIAYSRFPAALPPAFIPFLWYVAQRGAVCDRYSFQRAFDVGPTTAYRMAKLLCHLGLIRLHKCVSYSTYLFTPRTVSAIWPYNYRWHGHINVWSMLRTVSIANAFLAQPRDINGYFPYYLPARYTSTTFLSTIGVTTQHIPFRKRYPEIALQFNNDPNPAALRLTRIWIILCNGPDPNPVPQLHEAIRKWTPALDTTNQLGICCVCTSQSAYDAIAAQYPLSTIPHPLGRPDPIPLRLLPWYLSYTSMMYRYNQMRHRLTGT